jgi:nitrous oxide reductase accessory protein NosL
VRAQGTRFEVVLLPYEMQISEAAARRYAELGIHWEPGFETGSAQAELAGCLDGIPVHDARAAFAATPAARARIGVGELFVYDLGDKLDWNHPNRAGHARLAAFLEARLPWLDAPAPGSRAPQAVRGGPGP